MPIRPEMLARYPKDWKAIRERILKRAGDCCELCRKAHYDEALRLQHIREYLSELGRKGAAARKAKRAAA